MAEQDFQKTFDLFLDSDPSGYDALADFDDDGEEYDESSGQAGPLLENQSSSYRIAKAKNLTPAEKIDDLFRELAPRRRVLLGILAYLDTPQRSDALKEKVIELQKHDLSVYDGFDFSCMLFQAGAIVKVSEDGSDFDEEAERQPDIVEIDGVRFYKPTDGKQVFWVISDDGRAYVNALDAWGCVRDMLAAEPQYATIYRDILEACASDAGRNAKELKDLIEANPLTKQPHRFSNYFVKRLEDCDALLWEGQWSTTQLGLRALEELLGGEDESAGGADGGSALLDVAEGA